MCRLAVVYSYLGSDVHGAAKSLRLLLPTSAQTLRTRSKHAIEVCKKYKTVYISQEIHVRVSPLLPFYEDPFYSAAGLWSGSVETGPAVRAAGRADAQLARRCYPCQVQLETEGKYHDPTPYNLQKTGGSSSSKKEDHCRY